MKICIRDITIKFDHLINQALTREEVANWANMLQETEDKGCLEYIPKTDELKIWKAIIYLAGIDLKDSPNSYLHNIDDFVSYRKEIGV